MQQFFHQHGSEILSKGFEHLYISGLALIIGIIIAVPLGVLLTRFPKAATIVIGLTSALQTIPSLALLALMIPLFGVGKLPRLSHSLFIHYCRFYVIRTLG
ncbi:Glycine betaine/carnitine/choline transport system permease protein OpuCB [Enterococcus faecium]|nr:Glycine betaine/carnitine/choline transport system permease protein OpuCB [Enterococcus faecium]